MIYLILIIGGLYVLVIASFFYGWIKLKPFQYANKKNDVKVSVLIPFRNEEKNIPQLLNVLISQSYPQYLVQIIAINDHSTDNSINKIEELNIHNLQILNLPEGSAGKKAALLAGLNAATGVIIITTDSDCIPTLYWIETIVNYYHVYNPVMVLAPVIGRHHHSIFNKFQELELYSLLGSTAGALAIRHPVMCNGGNLSYSREVLEKIKEVYGNTCAASGDDIFTLLTLKKKYPGRINYIKSIQAMVTTRLENTLPGFINQRKRWASKARYYRDRDIIFTALAVLFINLLLLFLLIKSIISGSFIEFGIAITLKSLVDFTFLYHITSFFKSKKLLKWFPVAQGFYFLYITFTFFGSFTTGFTWKSRKFKS
jgi:cellulose synthase/poly-beta-1,6-N-acetylglucosamine synthase-like glycosyltransferase